MSPADQLKRARWLASIGIAGASWGIASVGVVVVLARRGDFEQAAQAARELPEAMKFGARLAALRLPTVITPTALVGWVLRGMPVSKD